MGRTIKTAMEYEKMPVVKSKQKDVDRTLIKEMGSSRLIKYGLAELYSRYSTELWAFLCFLTWAIIIWDKLSG